MSDSKVFVNSDSQAMLELLYASMMNSKNSAPLDVLLRSLISDQSGDLLVICTRRKGAVLEVLLQPAPGATHSISNEALWIAGVAFTDKLTKANNLYSPAPFKEIKFHTYRQYAPANYVGAPHGRPLADFALPEHVVEKLKARGISTLEQLELTVGQDIRARRALAVSLDELEQIRRIVEKAEQA